MSTRRRRSSSNINQEILLIDLPNELIEDGKNLLIERSAEIYVDGFHLIRPHHSIRETNHFSLIDLQHFPEENLCKDRFHLFQLIVQIPSTYLRQGKSIEIEKSDEKSSWNYFDENEEKFSSMKIFLDDKTLRRGFIHLIEKDRTSLIDEKDFSNDSIYHWNKNLFTIRDHLQSNQLMQITIALDPDFLTETRRIILKKEDAKSISTHFPYRRQSKVNIEQQLNQNERRRSLEEFLNENLSNSKLFVENHLLKVSIDLKTFSLNWIEENPVRLNLDGKNSLRIDFISSNENSSKHFQSISFPDEVQLDQFRYHLDRQNQLLHLSIPLQH